MRFDCSFLDFQKVARLLELFSGKPRTVEYESGCILNLRPEKTFLWLKQSYIYSAMIFTRIRNTFSYFQKYGRTLLRKLILCVRIRGRNKNGSVNDIFSFFFA